MTGSQVDLERIVCLETGTFTGNFTVGETVKLETGGPVTGLVVDRTGTYRPAWIGAAVASLLAAAVMLLADRRRSRSSAS